MDQERAAALAELSDKLGYHFHDLGLLEAALRHSSYVHEHPDQAGESNERMEFLGDAVLELVITQLLFERFPQASEGQLSKARSGVVNEGRLAATAGTLGLGHYLLLGKGEESQNGHQKPSILADALEAVAAAIYLDGGLEAARQVLLNLLGPVAEQAILRAPKKDYKTRLQERVQEALHITPRYLLLSAEGPDHDKLFLVSVEIDGQAVATGQGRSKKEAEQHAAQQGLDLWPRAAAGDDGSGEALPPTDAGGSR
ncbi:MAG: ribonuclease III [Desulfarculus sp.]|nr:ribonuclease III [Desulfarculus sp.]